MTFSPQFQITHSITKALTQIERARGFLEAAILSEQWIKAMQDRALVLEAHYTTHIEGTQLTLDQSAKLLAGEYPPNTDPNDAQELFNYRSAFELVADYLNCGDPVNEVLIREIHKRLVSQVRGNAAAPGDYRKIQNYVVNSKTGETVYTPPPVYEIPRMMSELVHWINGEETVSPILVSGIAQFQLVHIHPFLDGNRRTARLLSTLCLYRKGYDFKKLFTISEYYDRNRIDYYQAIQSVRSNHMDMTQWLEYFTQGLAVQMKEIQAKGEQVIKKDVLIRQEVLNPRQQSAIEYVIAQGALTIKMYEQLFPQSNRRTLQRELKELVDKAILAVEGATNQRIYTLRK